jgi:hypothetical protein
MAVLVALSVAAVATVAPPGPAGAAASGAPRVEDDARALVPAAQLTAAGGSLFLGARPRIEDRATFAASCASDSSEALVLGCYQARRNRIHVLRVDRPELADVMTVTAAFEALHVAYTRLGRDERERVDAMVDQAFSASRDERLRALAASYASLPDRARHDALHSVLGTQVAQLPGALEQYYDFYFQDRQSVVGAFWSYKAAFDAVVTDLARRGDEIRARKADVDAVRKQCEAAGAEADRLTASLKETHPRDQLEVLVVMQNAAVDKANDLARKLVADVAQVNALVAAYNALTFDDQQVIEALEPVTAS